MKSERLAVLKLLELKIITAEEAERLILALSDADSAQRINKADIKRGVEEKLYATGEALNILAKRAGSATESAAKEIKKMAARVSERSDKGKRLAEDFNVEKEEPNASPEDFEDADKGDK